MIDNVKINATYMSGKNGSNGQIGRQILSFSDFKKKISLIPMEEEIRKIILERVNKYPEASLDYVWKRLQDFISAASRERANRNRKMHQPLNKVEPQPVELPVAEVEEPVKKVVKPVPKPAFVRPSFDLEEFDIPNKENEGEIKDDKVH